MASTDRYLSARRGFIKRVLVRGLEGDGRSVGRVHEGAVGLKLNMTVVRGKRVKDDYYSPQRLRTSAVCLRH